MPSQNVAQMPRMLASAFFSCSHASTSSERFVEPGLTTNTVPSTNVDRMAASTKVPTGGMS